MILYRLIHLTRYLYETPASRARHFMHLIPRPAPGQSVRRATLTVAPHPSDRSDATDYFGNHTTMIGISVPHGSLDVTMEAEIAIDPAPSPALAGLAWDALAEDTVQPAIAEFRLPTRLTGSDAAIAAFAASCFPPRADLMAATTGLMHALHAAFRYRPGSTTVATTGAGALARQEGVCQDYAHAMLACLRARNLPCRYVSGYLRSATVAGAVAHRGAEQTHAWVAAWLGPSHGWIGFDPTNDLVVATDHVTLAWGRDYDDVSPIRGIIRGGGRHTPEVSVWLEPA